MDKHHYIEYLLATSAKVSPFVSDLIDSCREFDRSLREVLFHFVARRLNKPLLKPALLRAVFEFCGGRDWEQIVPACAAFELINISSYQANTAFDNKLGILTREQKDSQFIAAMISRELAQRAILPLGATHGRFVPMLVELLSESNRFIYVAQHWDLNVLHVAHFSAYRDRTRFLEEYTRRCFYGSGIFSGLCAEAGALLAGAAGATVEGIRAFAQSYGTALHMVNDLGDYIPSNGEAPLKEYQDQYSDFRNGRLTLPLWHLLTTLDGEELQRLKQLLMKGTLEAEECWWVAQMMCKIDTPTLVRQLVREHLRTARAQLRSIQAAADRAVLSLMAATARSNKHFSAWRKLSTSKEATCKINGSQI